MTSTDIILTIVIFLLAIIMVILIKAISTINDIDSEAFHIKVRLISMEQKLDKYINGGQKNKTELKKKIKTLEKELNRLRKEAEENE